MEYTREDRHKLYEDAVKYWGMMAQYDQCVEESAELIVAINKYKRKCLYNEYVENDAIVDNLVEELADVSMCIEQLIDFVGKDRFKNKLNEKLDKLSGQINKAKLKQDNK